MRTVARSDDFSADIEAILTPVDPFKLPMRGFWLLMFSDCDLYLCTSRLLESNSWSLTYDPSFFIFYERICKAESDFYSCVLDLGTRISFCQRCSIRVTHGSQKNITKKQKVEFLSFDLGITLTLSNLSLTLLSIFTEYKYVEAKVR